MKTLEARRSRSRGGILRRRRSHKARSEAWRQGTSALILEYRGRSTSVSQSLSPLSRLKILLRLRSVICRRAKNAHHLINQIITLMKKQGIGNITSSIFEIGALTIAIIILTNKFYAGSVTIGGFVMFFAAVRNANSFLNGIISNLTGRYSIQ